MRPRSQVQREYPRRVMAPVISQVELHACRLHRSCRRWWKEEAFNRVRGGSGPVYPGKSAPDPPFVTLLNVAQTNRDEAERSSFGWRPNNIFAVRSCRLPWRLGIRCRLQTITPVGRLRVQSRGRRGASALGRARPVVGEPGRAGGTIGGQIVQPLINLH